MPHHLELQTPIRSFCLTLSIIEPLKGAEALLHKACQLIKEESDIKDFGSVSFNNFKEAEGDFVEAKRNHAFLNENLLSDNDSDQNSD